MTGFGKSSAQVGGKKITVEVRSLNSKQLDLNLRIPSVYRDKENDIRNDVSKQVERGKVDLSIYFESGSEGAQLHINKTLAKAYHKELKSLSRDLKENQKELLGLVLKMPDVLRAEKQEMSEKEWKVVKQCLAKAITAFTGFREDEGKSLHKEFTKRVGLIAARLEEINELDKQRIETVRQRLRTAVEGLKVEVDQIRFEQELIYYLEKLDITEEKVRLKTHCDYFFSTMKEPSCGRKLGFISQEIGREINTIGSKCNDAGIQHLVVIMKDELEKIKEQINNVL